MFAPTRNLLLLVVTLLFASCGGSDVLVTDMQKEISELKGAIEKLGQEIDGIKQEREGVKEEWTSAKQTLDSIQKELAGLKKQARRKKPPKVVIVQKDFYAGMLDDDTKGIKVSGIVKNAGDQDASQVILEVTCQGCSERAQEDTWFTFMDSARAKIDYLPAGQSADFEIQFARVQGTPRALRDKDPPEGIDVKVTSFDRVK
jgi:hypothetical protein